MALGAQPHNEAGIIQPLPSGLTAAFTLKDVRQVKDGMTVLDGVELDIPHGAITALVEPSGAGKTSLLRLLNRLDDPVSGAIVYRARAITHYPVQALRRKVGFVFQTPVMFPGTVRENLQAALTLGGPTDGDDTPFEPGAAADGGHGHASLIRSTPYQRYDGRLGTRTRRGHGPHRRRVREHDQPTPTGFSRDRKINYAALCRKLCHGQPLHY